ncbi:MAG: flagellar biosynthetic protein FliO [Bacteroidetes bacterium]|nr:flagellar biosynthetic protein FliO [Bacteroidota bacterium]
MEVADFLNALLPLFIVFGLLWGIMYYVKKYTNTAKSKVSKSLNVQVISNQMILPKKFISVVKVKDSLLVLGISEGSINLLKELEYDADLDEELESGGISSNFLDILKKNLPSR